MLTMQWHGDAWDVITNCKPKLADFSLTGRLDSQVFQIAKPITGTLKIEKCKAKVASIDVQLVRNEEVKIDGTAANDLTEVQSIQLVDGDIGPDLEIPIFVILPRLYTCPSLTTKDFSINFELNIVVAFQDEQRITKTEQSEMAAIKFPIRLMR
ncbi:hypothetical protein CYMTET_21791 [Cymbomonas tetramitiformis]|uniref:Uncharacterized protein n=1 Tax=Cymbomonas tetramitiformis TaxID=36881 RepID=A0AAE0G1H9_9CHLO|nr:hypothetical protein CYMTET_21791 [Cymbomonas tetramitiformis]